MYSICSVSNEIRDFVLESRHVSTKNKTLDPIKGDQNAISSCDLLDKIHRSPKHKGYKTKVGKEWKVTRLYLTQGFSTTQVGQCPKILKDDSQPSQLEPGTQYGIIQDTDCCRIFQFFWQHWRCGIQIVAPIQESRQKGTLLSTDLGLRQGWSFNTSETFKGSSIFQKVKVKRYHGLTHSTTIPHPAKFSGLK